MDKPADQATSPARGRVDQHGYVANLSPEFRQLLVDGLVSGC